jgi:nuclear GTP-binding protein
VLQLLKNYARNTSGGKGSITVGVVGLPNVGKSSLINSLKRARVAQVRGWLAEDLCYVLADLCNIPAGWLLSLCKCSSTATAAACIIGVNPSFCRCLLSQQVGSTPGVTKGLQEIHLDKHIRLLDSPGIVFASGEGAAAAALRNAIKVRLNLCTMVPEA